MKLTGLHILLTYQCTYACDHCFVWGSPWQSGTMTIARVHQALAQAQDVHSVESIYFEGGEPFLFYSILLDGVKTAFDSGFKVGIVSNAYWATSREDAHACLKPFAGLIEDLTVSSDLFHSSDLAALQIGYARAAAGELGIPTGTISIAPPGEADPNQGTVMYRGRAARVLANRAPLQPWDRFTSCPHEDLREPGRVHLDPFGYVHICQGICLGNAFESSLAEISSRYDPQAHPVAGPLLEGGPAALASEYSLPHAEAYPDACALCYESRLALRDRFPEILGPDQMYGVGLED